MRFTMDFGKNDDDVLNTLIVLSAKGKPRSRGRAIIKFAEFFVVVFGIAMVLCSYLFDATALIVAGLIVAVVGVVVAQQATKHYLDQERAEQLADLDTALYRGHRSFEVGAAGVRIQTGRGPRVFAWGDLASWGVYSHYVYARGGGGELVLVDANQLGDGQREELEALLEERLGPREASRR